MTAGVFLTAEWRHLAMLSWRVDPALLHPLVPRGTVLDTWRGEAFVSVVGFLFRDTRLLGVPVPGHRTFEEVNLRFYVRRETAGEVRRAVAFVRELVPRRAIAAVARRVYNEPYLALRMRHRLGPVQPDTGAPSVVEYAWRQPEGWSRLAVEPAGAAAELAPGTEEAFIAEHYWGYTRQRDGGTVEYRVEHPSWRVWRAARWSLEGDLAALYGRAFAGAIAGAPSSVFLADGSPVTVRRPVRLADAAGARGDR